MHHRGIIATGGSDVRGELIGKTWHDSIITILKSTETAALSKDGMTLPDWLPHARGLLPFIQEHAPNTLEEMKGMAAGSDLSFDNILLLTCAYEKWFDDHTPEHCTAFAVMGSLIEKYHGEIDVSLARQILFEGWLSRVGRQKGRPITGMLKGINYPNQTHLGTPYCCIF